MFEDAAVEKEVDIRKRVLRDFNKKEEDFATLREYNDYLEEIEVIIYNLVNNIDIVNTNKKIEEYKKANKEYIMKSKGKLSREEYELEEILELEKQHNEYTKVEQKQLEVEAKKKKVREKEALIDELMFSNANAKNILETFAQSAKQVKEAEAKQIPSRATQFSSGIKFGRQSHAPLPMTIEEGPLYVYKPQTFATDGPIPPTSEEINSEGYKSHVRTETEQELAGGFISSIACMRALQEALTGLYHVKKQQLSV